MNFNDFDKQFNKTKKRVIAVSIILSLIKLAIIGLIIYVVIHFLGKVW